MIIIKNDNLRKALKIIVPFLLIPSVVIIGSFFFEKKHHFAFSSIVVLLSLLFFITGIEKKNIGTRRIVLVAVMTALCVIGRFIPYFQPITALTIITGVYLGAESGFLVGASSAFLSNFYFGQGPWTPFQMISWGVIGLLAGYFSRFFIKNKLLLIIYGVLCGILYSLLMDVWSTIMYNGSFNYRFYIASVITAMPFTVVYSVSNLIFLCFFVTPFGKKLNRIKVKYGI
jgi:energy-coupling factor transport system substrate-specific component